MAKDREVRVTSRTYEGYESLLVGTKLLVALRPLDVQAIYHRCRTGNYHRGRCEAFIGCCTQRCGRLVVGNNSRGSHTRFYDYTNNQSSLNSQGRIAKTQMHWRRRRCNNFSIIGAIGHNDNGSECVFACCDSRIQWPLVNCVSSRLQLPPSAL
jgi:hypothetical protein